MSTIYKYEDTFLLLQMYISMFADFVLGSYIHSHMQKDSFSLGYSLKKEAIV